MKFWLLIGSILGLMYLLLSRVLKGVLNPYTQAQRKKSAEDKAYYSDGKYDLEQIQRTMTKRMPIIQMSEEQEADVSQKLRRLGLELTVKDVRKLQALYVSVVLVVGAILGLLLSPIVFLISLAISTVAWKIPIANIDKQIRARNQSVEANLPKLWGVLYYAYRRSPSVHLTGKIQSYMRNTSGSFYEELELFVEDARSGEIYALKEFKKRVPIPIVIRFCDIMETRLEGYDNTGLMDNFKSEMDLKRELREQKILDDLEARLETLSQIGIYIPLVLIVMTYFGAQLASSL